MIQFTLFLSVRLSAGPQFHTRAAITGLLYSLPLYEAALRVTPHPSFRLSVCRSISPCVSLSVRLSVPCLPLTRQESQL